MVAFNGLDGKENREGEVRVWLGETRNGSWKNAAAAAGSVDRNFMTGAPEKRPTCVTSLVAKKKSRSRSCCSLFGGLGGEENMRREVELLRISALSAHTQ
ncbi:hypothetical protein L1887_24429 [Cichorium endivia]|nr:hypothetical protein L1887_24429 [Cichorium endivia]